MRRVISLPMFAAMIIVSARICARATPALGSKPCTLEDAVAHARKSRDLARLRRRWRHFRRPGTPSSCHVRLPSLRRLSLASTSGGRVVASAPGIVTRARIQDLRKERTLQKRALLPLLKKSRKRSSSFSSLSVRFAPRERSAPKTSFANLIQCEAVGTCASRRPRRCASCDRKRHGRASRAAPLMAFGFASRAGTLAVAAVPSTPCLVGATHFTITSRRVRGMLCAWMRPAARCTATRAMTGSSPSRHGSCSCGPSLFPSLPPRPSPIHRPRRHR